MWTDMTINACPTRLRMNRQHDTTCDTYTTNEVNC